MIFFSTSLFALLFALQYSTFFSSTVSHRVIDVYKISNRLFSLIQIESPRVFKNVGFVLKKELSVKTVAIWKKQLTLLQPHDIM